MKRYSFEMHKYALEANCWMGMDTDDGVWVKYEDVKELLKAFDGVLCNHPGCAHHVTHPCEQCGRKWGDNEPE